MQLNIALSLLKKTVTHYVSMLIIFSGYTRHKTKTSKTTTTTKEEQQQKQQYVLDNTIRKQTQIM